MRNSLITSSIAIALACVAPAHSQESFESIVTSCESAPAEAKTDLPPVLSEWAVLSCTRYGHVVRAAKGWVWHNPRKNSLVRVWSQPANGELDESGHKNYFKSLEFRKLSPEETESANAVIAKGLGAKPQPAADAYALRLVDAQGRTQTVNFVRSEANIRLGTFWGSLCSSPYVEPEIFMGFKPEK